MIGNRIKFEKNLSSGFFQGNDLNSLVSAVKRTVVIHFFENAGLCSAVRATV